MFNTNIIVIAMPKKSQWKTLIGRYRLLFICAIFAQYILIPYVTADEVIELTNGNTISGRILNPSEAPRKTWQIQLAQGITLELPHPGTVRQVPMQHEMVSQYFDRVPFYAESVENHLKLAEICNSNNMINFSQLHYERVLELDPDNQVARQALNYRKVDGEWTTYEGEMLRQGYVKTKRGTWTTPQNLMISEQKIQVGSALQPDVPKNMQNFIEKLKSPDQQEADQALVALRTPAAVTELAKGLKSEPDSKLRDLYVRALAKIGNDMANREISLWSIQEPSEEVCWTCITKMRSVPGLSKHIIPYLNNQDNVTLNRAAYVIGRLGDRAAIPALIDVLITEHKVPVNRNLKPETATELVSNREVLMALQALTGENFRYDIQSWRNWWSIQNRAAEFDARRGSYDK